MQKINFNKVVYFLIILLLFFIFYKNWYAGSQYLISSDNNLIIDLNKYLDQKISTWQSKYYPGGSDFFRSPFATFEYLFGKIFLIFSDKGEYYLKIINIFLWLFSFVSINKFLNLFKIPIPKYLIYVISVLYTFNIYNLIVIGSFNPIIFRISFYPLFLYYFVKFLRSLLLNNIKIIDNKYLFKLLLVYFFFIIPSYQTPPFLIIDFIIAILLITIYPKKLLINRQFYAFILLSILISLFFIYGFVNEYLFTDLNNILFINENFSPKYHYDLNSIYLSTISRLDGYFGFYSSFNDYNYYPASNFYNNNFFFFIISLSSFIGIYFLIFVKKNLLDVEKFLLLLFIIFSILIAGKFSIFNEFSKLLIIDSGLIGLFRSVYQRFGFLLSIANTVLILYAYHFIFEKINEIKYLRLYIVEFKIIYLTIFLLNLIPFFSGEIFNTSGFGSKRVELPSEYNELKNFLNSSIKNQNILVLPHSQINIWNLNWNDLNNGYGGQYPLNIDLDHNFFNFYENSIEEYQINKFLINPNDMENIRDMNITSIIIHYDFNFTLMESQWYYVPSHNIYNKIKLVEKKLDNNSNFLKKIFGNIVLYYLEDINEYNYPINLKSKK